MATAPGYTAPRADVEAFIANAARKRGIDPNIALEVYRREGAGGWQSSVVKNGIREPSYGPFQLYTGGGLGNKFQKETGLDPRDPSTWQQNITFALDEAKKGGWGPWMGAKAAGITGFAGINGVPAAVAQNSSPLRITVNKAPEAPIPQLGATPANQGQSPLLGGAMALGPMPMLPMQFDQPIAPQMAPPVQRRPLNLTGLAAMLRNAPPAIRNLIAQG